MDKDAFFEEFESGVDTKTFIDFVYDEMAAYCRENDITEEELSNDDLLSLAEGFVERGFDK